MRKSLETTIDRGRETITPEKRRKMRQEELKKIYEEIERAPTRRKKALGATLALSTMLAVGWWYFQNERDLDEEKEGDTMGESGSESAVLREGGRGQVQKPRSPEIKEWLRRMIEQVARHMTHVPEAELDSEAVSSDELLERQYRVISDAGYGLDWFINGEDAIFGSEESWDSLGEYLANIDNDFQELLALRNRLSDDPGVPILPIELIYSYRIADIQELLHNREYQEAYRRVRSMLSLLQEDRSLFQSAVSASAQ